MLSIIKRIFGSEPNSEQSEEENENQLWIMIKEDDFFRDEKHLEIIDEITEIIEGECIGELDGHSSGAYQLEVNFFDVTDYEKAKTLIMTYFKNNYSNLEYTISNDYETTYEKP